MRKVGRIVGLLLGLLLLFMVFNGSAYKTADTGEAVHETMVSEAFGIYPKGEIYNYLDQIKHGSMHEDMYDHVYDISWPYLYYPHFWDADKGDYDPSSMLGSQNYPNAWIKATKLWGMALGEYAAGDKAHAYEYLGHVAHLLQDMSVPAHAHEDPHTGVIWVGGGDDCFEDWMTWEHAQLTLAERNKLWTDGPVEIPDYDDPWDSLYYLFYTTNQVADFFASDDRDGDTYDRLNWMGPIYTELGMDTITSPRTQSQLTDNDWGDNDDDGDLSTIREHSYFYAIRATAALFKLFYETAWAELPLTVVIDRVENKGNHGWWENPDYYVYVKIKYSQFLNKGDQITGDNIYPGWAFQRSVKYTGSVDVKIELYDDDPGTDDHSDIDWDNGNRDLDLTVNLETGAISGDLTGNWGDTLVSEGRENPDSKIWFRILKPNLPPTANTGSDQTVNEGDLVNFYSYFNDPDFLPYYGCFCEYEWDFGDGGKASGTKWEASGTLTSTHTYADNGVYTVTLTVTDIHGTAGSDSSTVTVYNVAPTVNAGADQTVNEGDMVSLDPATYNDKGTLDTHTATINWGDGTSTEPGTISENPFGPPGSTAGMVGTVSGSHVYADNGVYTVTVTVTDDDGAVTTDTVTITVNNIAPTVYAGADQTVNEGDLVCLDPTTFNDKGTLDTHTATINWGDGIIEAGAVSENTFGPPGSTAGMDGTVSGSHVYADDGDYTVIVTVTDDDGALSSDTITITVYNVAPTLDAGVDQTVNEGDLVNLDPSTFNDKGTLDTHTATINWGDGIIETGAVSESPFGPPGSSTGMDGTVSGSHVYADNDVYTMTVTVTDDDGAVTADTITITVHNVAPTLDAGADQTVNEGDLASLDPATFNDKGTLDTHTATINWGDGTSTEAGTVSENPFGPPGSTSGMDGTVSGDHVYADNNDYAVTVTSTDDDGAVTADTITITVHNVAPTVDAGVDQTVNEGDVVSLDPATFNDKGTLDTHTATINWGDGTSTEAGTVTESPFGPPGSTAGMDGTVSGSHVYADNGVYTVTVTVTDDDGAVTADTVTITVNNVAPTVWAGADQTVNEGDLVNLDPTTFNDKGTLDTHTATINWGDGIIEAGAVSESPFGPPGSTAGMDGTVSGSHVYADNGVYTVTVTVTDDDGAVTSDTITITVHNVAPTVDAGADQTMNEGDAVSLDPTTFNDKGTLDTHTATIDWGDGSGLEVGTVSESPFGPPGSTSGASGTVSGSHTYGDDGVYTVTITVTDDDGAVGSDMFFVTVDNVAPIIENVEAYIPVDFTLRAAGEKWHNVEMFIYEDGVEIDYAEVVRCPGSPDDQSVTLYDVKCDVTKAIEVEVVYTPLDDRVNGQPNGATPVWVTIDFEDGEDIMLHHTCNVKHPDTWEWNIYVNQYLVYHEITFKATGSDQGSDDLTFDWSWGDGTLNSIITYYNNAPINTSDPYPSPWGTYPYLVVDSVKHTFPSVGNYTVTLTLTDDDGDSDVFAISIILS